MEKDDQMLCLRCASSQIMRWRSRLGDGDKFQRDRQLVQVASEDGGEWEKDWIKIHCTYLRSAVPYPDRLVDCPWFSTPDEAARREVAKRKKEG